MNFPLTGRVTCDGTIVSVGAGPVAPDEEEIAALRPMLPVKSLMVLSVTLKKLDVPGNIVRVFGFVLSTKSGEIVDSLQAVTG